MLWMAVTADQYELPICVEDTARELAQKLGVCRSNILARKHRGNTGMKCGYMVVTVDE